MNHVSEDHVKHQPRHEQRQREIQRLSANVKDQWFSTLEVWQQFSKVCFQSNAHECKAEEPASKGLRRTFDGRI
ncbi:MAG: hypothetical protein HC806_05585 [Anaerolineae bacterium]|nr:hypothetical protein [Anaerolineae bacterium]